MNTTPIQSHTTQDQSCQVILDKKIIHHTKTGKKTVDFCHVFFKVFISDLHVYSQELFRKMYTTPIQSHTTQDQSCQVILDKNSYITQKLVRKLLIFVMYFSKFLFLIYMYTAMSCSEK